MNTEVSHAHIDRQRGRDRQTVGCDDEWAEATPSNVRALTTNQMKCPVTLIWNPKIFKIIFLPKRN